MPRPIQYEKKDVEELIKLKLERGIPIKASCLDKGWPYVSINKALRRYGLSIPKKYAEVKAKYASTMPKNKPRKVSKPKIEVQVAVTPPTEA